MELRLSPEEVREHHTFFRVLALEFNAKHRSYLETVDVFSAVEGKFGVSFRDLATHGTAGVQHDLREITQHRAYGRYTEQGRLRLSCRHARLSLSRRPDRPTWRSNPAETWGRATRVYYFRSAHRFFQRIAIALECLLLCT